MLESGWCQLPVVGSEKAGWERDEVKGVGRGEDSSEEFWKGLGTFCA